MIYKYSYATSFFGLFIRIFEKALGNELKKYFKLI